MPHAHFSSIEKLDTAILYLFELLSSVAVLLLAFGLIASMANVLTEGSVLSDNLTMQRVWAWTQCVAIDASVAGTILRTFQYYGRREWVKTVLSALLSGLLLFTAAIVSNIEALQQTLNVALSVAYAHVFVPVEALIWIRSLCIVLLIVAHALRHVHPEQVSSQVNTTVPSGQPPHAGQDEQPPARSLLTDQSEQPALENDDSSVLPALPDDQGEQPPPVRLFLAGANREGDGTGHGAHPNAERIRLYRQDHPQARVREIARALSLSPSTVSKWLAYRPAEAIPTQPIVTAPLSAED